MGVQPEFVYSIRDQSVKLRPQPSRPQSSRRSCSDGQPPANAQVCYKAVAASRMQVAWRRCWQIVGALRRQLPAVLNALAHERAVAWAERKEKDASKEVMGPDSETAKAAADINNQAAYLVCRRIACC